MGNKVHTYTGFKPLPHQWDVIKELENGKKSGKTVVVKSSRQKGKSLMVENLLLYYSINFKGTSICVSPVLSQARKIFQDIVAATEGSDIIRKKNETLLEIEFVGGSRILFKSAEQKESLRGYTVTNILCIDEAAFVDDEIFYKILPWCDVYQAPILMTSSPFVKSGFFFEYFNRGLDGEKNIISIDWSSPKYKESVEILLPPERLEEYRRALPANQFRSEYLGEFLDDEGSVFTGFNNCVYKNSIQPGDKLVVGIDWGNGGSNDDTALSILNTQGKQVYLAYWNNLTPTQQIDHLVGILEPIKKQIVLIEPELNSIGTPYTDLLKQRLQYTNICGFNTTNASKDELVSHLQVAFEQQQIEILPDDKQLRELGTYMAEYNLKTKKVSYNAPQGLNDDLCIALMLSWDAYLKHNKRGNYSIKVI